jgi:hypothetical protein
MSIETIVRTINLILAPVVMITSCVLFLNGLLTRYETVSSRMRSMHRERLELLQTSDKNTHSIEHAESLNTQRICEIETQLPNMLLRHKMIRNAVLTINTAILIFIISMFIIADATIANSPTAAAIALFTFLIGTGALLIGVIITTAELYRSQREVAYEIQDGLKIGKA